MRSSLSTLFWFVTLLLIVLILFAPVLQTMVESFIDDDNVAVSSLRTASATTLS